MRIFGLHTGGRYCLLFCHKSGTIVPQPHKKMPVEADRQTQLQHHGFQDPQSPLQEKIQMFLSEYTTIPSMPPHIRTLPQTKRKKMQTFPVSKAAARTVFPVKCCYMRTVLKSIYLISGKDPLSYTLTGLQEKHPQKIQAETGILLFSHTPHIHFSSVYAFFS